MKYIRRFNTVADGNGVTIYKPCLTSIADSNDLLLIPENSDYASTLTLNPLNNKLEVLEKGVFYATYNVTDISTTTKLLNSNWGIYIMEIDGNKVSTSTSYQFATIGNHYVKYELWDVIRDSVFSDCTSLTSITIPDSVTSIDWRAFYGCTGLTSITIPNSVTSIGEGAFQNCTGLTSITIPDSVTSIGTGAFMECSSLTSITIPNSVTSIGEGVFVFCDGLTSITIVNGVTSISYYEFGGCTGLPSITIPDSVTSIGEGAFNSCIGLTSITYSGTMAQWNAISLGYNWHMEVPATVVHCSDGDVTLS